jgi:hypothetical protein
MLRSLATLVAFTALLASGCGAQMSTPSVTPLTSAGPTRDSIWRSLDGVGFPSAGASLSAITADSEGFVIAGSTEGGTPDCQTQRQAHIWTSRDAVNWADATVEGAVGASVDVLSETDLAFGRTGSPGCGGGGPVVWRRGEAGWQRPPTTGLQAGDEIVDVVELSSGDLVASGHYADDDAAMGLWSVDVEPNGTQWQRASQPPRSVRGSTLTALASDGHVLIGFDVTRDPHAWHSVDGQTWASSDFDASYGFLTTSAGYGPGSFMAGGRSCCGLPEQRFGTLIASPDGKTWTPARPDLAFAEPVEAVIATAAGWIALGEETYLTADGTDWRLGPPIVGFESKVHTVNSVPVPYLLAAAAWGDLVVAITPDHGWVATLDDLAAAKWQSPAPTPEMPIEGSSYEATLPTHCGPFNGPLNFDGRSWIPDLPNGSFPLSFDYYYETGMLKFVRDDMLQFTGARGDVITYRPTDDPPHGAPCH